MTKFRKKPVVIEAMQFPGCDIINNSSSGGIVDSEKFDQFVAFDSWALGMGAGAYLRYVGNTIQISTLEGVMTANPGDWIIKGVNGEFYPCKDDIFQKTYERDSD